MKGTAFDLTGRVALVTGGSKGLGQAIARTFAQAGADVIISARHESDLARVAEEIRAESGGRIAYVVADLLKRADTERLADAALAQFGKVDILVNNAGTNRPQPIDEISDKDWDELFELNVTSCMLLTRRLAPQMKERRWGRIIYMSSMMAIATAAGRSIYSATKAALIGMTRASALDLGPFGITVNCLAPGLIDTELSQATLTPERRAVIIPRVALERSGRPEEVAAPALLLASNAGSYITGSVLVVDGGITARVF